MKVFFVVTLDRRRDHYPLCNGVPIGGFNISGDEAEEVAILISIVSSKKQQC